MGQRTGTLVSYIDSKGQKHNKVYYNQWGIGRVQLNAFIGSFLTQLGREGLDLEGANSMRLETHLQGVENADFTNIEQVKDIFRQLDNNNGGVVIICDDQQPSNNQIGFILGSEECERYDHVKDEYVTTEPLFSRFVPFDEWADKVGGQWVNDSYKAMFHAFCKHFGFTIINDKVKGGQQWD